MKDSLHIAEFAGGKNKQKTFCLSRKMFLSSSIELTKLLSFVQSCGGPVLCVVKGESH